MDLKIWLILLLFISVICLDYRHNQLENLKNSREHFFLPRPYDSSDPRPPMPPFPITKNCRLTENKQPYNYPQPSDTFQSVAEECISQQDFKNKNYSDLNQELIINARIPGYPRQPRPLM